MRLLAFTLAAGLFAGSAFAQIAPAPTSRPTAVVPPAATTLAAPVKPITPRTALQGYSTEAAAKSACGGDAVVWGNTSSKVLHAAGAPYYGRTKRGAYMCQTAAMSSGYRMAKNGS